MDAVSERVPLQISRPSIRFTLSSKCQHTPKKNTINRSKLQLIDRLIAAKKAAPNCNSITCSCMVKEFLHSCRFVLIKIKNWCNFIWMTLYSDELKNKQMTKRKNNTIFFTNIRLIWFERLLPFVISVMGTFFSCADVNEISIFQFSPKNNVNCKNCKNIFVVFSYGFVFRLISTRFDDFRQRQKKKIVIVP